MTTPLTTRQQQRANAILNKLPVEIRLAVTRPPGALSTADSFLNLLDRHVDEVVRRVDDLHDKRRENERAATVLRSLRRDLENAADTLREQDERLAVCDHDHPLSLAGTCDGCGMQLAPPLPTSLDPDPADAGVPDPDARRPGIDEPTIPFGGSRGCRS